MRRLLGHLELECAAAPFEVIVSVDGSTDDTVEMLAAMATSYPLHVVQGENGGPAVARNRALRRAVGDVVIFLDDDVVPAAGLVASHLAAHGQGPDLVVIGALLPQPNCSATPWASYEGRLLERHVEALRSGRKAIAPRHFYTGNASVRRDHLLAVGGFDERLRRGEDVDLGRRLAERELRMVFASEAVVFHETDHDLETWLRIPYTYGRQEAALARNGRARTGAELQHDGLSRRRLATRALVRWCAGRPARARLVEQTFSRLIGCPGPHAVREALCSALFNLRYWQGFADARGVALLPTTPWPLVHSNSGPVSARPDTSEA